MRQRIQDDHINKNKMEVKINEKKTVGNIDAAVAVLAMPVNAMASGSISGAVDYNNVTATTESGEETETDGPHRRLWWEEMKKFLPRQ